MNLRISTKQESQNKMNLLIQSHQTEAERMQEIKAKLRKYMTDVGVDILTAVPKPELSEDKEDY